MIIPIPWHSADIRLKKLDIRVKPRRQVSKFHADGHGVSRILFLVCRFNRFFYFLRIISVPWYSAVIRVKKLWHLCESLSTCKLTRIVAEHHGFLFLVCQFNGISQLSQDYICSVILRDYPCEKDSDIRVKIPQTRPFHFPFDVSVRPSFNVRCILCGLYINAIICVSFLLF